MVITHHGGQCFKVTFGDLVLAFGPIGKKSKLTPVRFGADIALVSYNNVDMNGVGEVKSSGKDLFIISGPGEYERSGVTVQGFLTNGRYGLKDEQEDAVNTMYLVDLEGMTILYAGALNNPELTKEAREAIESVDILFVPVGADGVLDSAGARKFISSIAPKVIIPMHWSGIGSNESLEFFLKESGDKHETVEKLTIKKKDIVDKDGAIIVVTA